MKIISKINLKSKMNQLQILSICLRLVPINQLNKLTLVQIWILALDFRNFNLQLQLITMLLQTSLFRWNSVNRNKPRYLKSSNQKSNRKSKNKLSKVNSKLNLKKPNLMRISQQFSFLFLKINSNHHKLIKQLPRNRPQNNHQLKTNKLPTKHLKLKHPNQQ